MQKSRVYTLHYNDSQRIAAMLIRYTDTGLGVLQRRTAAHRPAWNPYSFLIKTDKKSEQKLIKVTFSFYNVNAIRGVLKDT